MDEKERDFLTDYAEQDGEQDEAEQVDETEQAEAPEPEAEKDEKPPEKAPEAPSAEEPQKEHHVPYAALKAERQKRQELANRLQELEEQANQQQVPRFNEAPEQYVQAMLARERHHLTQTMYASMEALARETYPDYDDVFVEVEAYVQENPAALHQLQAAANPAVEAYKLGKKVRELKEMRDPDTYRQKIEAEIRAKVEAEFREREEQRLKTAQAIPPDLSASRNVGGNDAPDPRDVFDNVFQPQS